LSASSWSQRQIVEAEASVTPRSTTSRCSSVRVKRDSGRPWVAGSSQAIALTSATCSGGKTARATRARLVAQPVEALFAESSPPLRDDLRVAVEPTGDLLVLHPRGRVEDQARPLDLAPRQRRRPRTPLEL
jgi:hypothetical protein